MNDPRTKPPTWCSTNPGPGDRDGNHRLGYDFYTEGDKTAMAP